MMKRRRGITLEGGNWRARVSKNYFKKEGSCSSSYG
jgi:hypothetical protein